ncbi:MAG TPA: DUF364 domain-containing protein [Bacillota bacterium]|nr:DUF364 domain-containing protein [Bacillota bacterium]
MWELYDELVEGIPDGITADCITVGLHWTVVTAGKYCGTAMTVTEQGAFPELTGSRRGQPLKHLASLAKSWNFLEASVGVAAINAYYNNRETWEQLKGQAKSPVDSGGGPSRTNPDGSALWEIVGSENAFDGYAQAVKGKKAAIIGHFRHLENYLTEAKEVSVLERRPLDGDYPDSACEYILPEQDFIFITGSTLVNKTLPRLLQLSRKAQVVLVGPSAPMTPILFRYGVDEMSGFLVADRDGVIDAASMAEHKAFFQCGERVRMMRRRV